MSEKFNDSEMVTNDLSEIDSYNPAKWPGQWSAEAERLYMIVNGIDKEQALLDSAEDGIGDAFRHVFSSALMTVYSPSSDIVQIIWSSHELSNKNSPLSHRMDLWNNEVGRQLGLFYKERFYEETYKFINQGIPVPDSFYENFKRNLAADVMTLIRIDDGPVMQINNEKLLWLFQDDPKLQSDKKGLSITDIHYIQGDIELFIQDIDILEHIMQKSEDEDGNGKDDKPGGDGNGESPDGDGGRGDGTGEDGDGHGGADDIPPPHRDPVIIDLNKNGKIDSAAKTYFDLDNNGFKESTAWASDGDGILVMDRNGDGVINNGTEVFGDSTILEDGSIANNGFEALSELDGNGDGVINADDAAYGGLKVWVDADGDGISAEDELISLQDAGVMSIDLSHETNGAVDENGNVIARTGTVEWEDGTAGLIAEMLLDADHMRNIPVNSVEIPADILALPELLGGGLMYDFRQVAAMDESGRLKSLMESFIAAEDEETRKAILEELVFVWSGVEDIAPNSRGSFIDARVLGVLEQYSARPFVGTEGTNPHENAAPVLKKTYETLMGHFYRTLLRQTDYAEYFGNVKNARYFDAFIYISDYLFEDGISQEE